MSDYDTYYDSTPDERAQRSREEFWFFVLIISFLVTVIALIIGWCVHSGPVAIIALVVGIPAIACSFINATGHPRPKLVASITVLVVLTIGGGIHLGSQARVMHDARAGSHAPLL